MNDTIKIAKEKTINKIIYIILGLTVFFIPINTTLVTICTILLFIFWLFSDYKKNIILCSNHPVNIAIYIFILLHVIYILYRIFDSSAGILQFTGDNSAFTITIHKTQEFYASVSQFKKTIRFLYIPIIMSIFIDHPPYSPKIKRLLNMFLAAVILNLILILLRFIHVLPDSLFPSFFENEVFKDRIFTSLFFSVASYIMCIYIINNKIFDLKNFVLSTVLTTMLYYLFAISCGRSGQLILLCLIVLLFFQNFRFKYIIYSILWLSTIIIFVVTIVPCSFSSRIDLAIKEVILFIYFPDIPTSNGFRLWMLKNSILLYLQKPWFGWGIGSIINAFSTLDNQMYGSVENPHNQFLVYMLQFGMLGVFAIGNLLWRIYKTSLTINIFYKNILQGLLLALIVGCMGNSWLNDFTSAHFFIFLLAILISSPGREILKK